MDLEFQCLSDKVVHQKPQRGCLSEVIYIVGKCLQRGRCLGTEIERNMSTKEAAFLIIGSAELGLIAEGDRGCTNLKDPF